MSPRTIFLSKLLGLYCILIALSMSVQKQAALDSVTALLHNPAMMLVLGVFTLGAGLAMVLAHNLWTRGVRAYRGRYRGGLVDADQGTAVLVPAARGGSGNFREGTCLSATFLCVHGDYAGARHVSGVWRIRVEEARVERRDPASISANWPPA